MNTSKGWRWVLTLERSRIFIPSCPMQIEIKLSINVRRKLTASHPFSVPLTHAILSPLMFLLETPKPLPASCPSFKRPEWWIFFTWPKTMCPTNSPKKLSMKKKPWSNSDGTIWSTTNCSKSACILCRRNCIFAVLHSASAPLTLHIQSSCYYKQMYPIYSKGAAGLTAMEATQFKPHSIYRYGRCGHLHKSVERAGCVVAYFQRRG